MHVCVFVFDILMLDGEALIKLSLRERRARISVALPLMKPGFVQLAQSLELSPGTEQDVCTYLPIASAFSWPCVLSEKNWTR